MNPALNIHRRQEVVATDTVFSDTPAVDSVAKQAQIVVGKDSLVAGAYTMKSGKQFVDTLKITLNDEEPWTNSLVIQPKLGYLTMF